MAEYDELTLRLVNTPTGRALALTESASPSESDLSTGGVPQSSWPLASKLLALRAKILAQKSLAEAHLSDLHRPAGQGFQIAPSVIQGLKFRTGALRGLVDDLKKLADEIDSPPTLEAERKKAKAEYDALVLRLVNTPVGRVLALFPPDRSWDKGQLYQAYPDTNQYTPALALLETRSRIQSQVERAEKALAARANFLRQFKDEPQRFAAAEARAAHEESVRKYEHEAKVATTTLRGLVGDLKKTADELDHPKGK
jgi:hypothetical protein